MEVRFAEVNQNENARLISTRSTSKLESGNTSSSTRARNSEWPEWLARLRDCDSNLKKGAFVWHLFDRALDK